MSPINTGSIDENTAAIYAYIANTRIPDINIQMEAIKKMILFFSKKTFLDADRTFIEYFPNGVYEEFKRMSRGETNGDRYRQKKNLFFDVLTFIFRNGHLIHDTNAESFLYLFLEFIKIGNERVYDPRKLLKSIKNCMKYESKRIIFINENGMFNFYFYFHHVMAKSENIFWRIFKSIYKLDIIRRSSLIPVELARNVSQIMSKYSTTCDDKCLRILIGVLLMLCRLKLLKGIEMEVTQFYTITHSLYKKNGPRPNYDTYLNDLTKIWIEILKGLTYTLEINNIDQLMIFATIFATHLSNKLKIISQSGRRFEVTNRIKQRLYIIYLALAAYPIIEKNKKRLVCVVLKKLHFSLQDYIQKSSIEYFTIETQFLILQYYIKSHLSLSIELSVNDESVFKVFLEKIILYPSLKLHYSFIDSQILVNFINKSCSEETFRCNFIIRIEKFMRQLISALSDDLYINKVKEEQKLVFYEDLNINYLSMIDENLIKNVFSMCKSRTLDVYKFIACDNIQELTDYRTYRKLISLLVLSFRQSNYLCQGTAKYLLKFLDDDSGRSFLTLNDGNELQEIYTIQSSKIKNGPYSNSFEDFSPDL
ncbi:hypothetical protein RF11_10584 [Thelohanellus kitauei]|uniref:Uncharacterized protein n=1 Tax=Thelohanellus kitauei TaxID=669202 RepID=A0A0C2JYC7_THEKT|nr:hypothetical protein RF11_10584 [Thelohanellus kitauei]